MASRTCYAEQKPVVASQEKGIATERKKLTTQQQVFGLEEDAIQQ
jgi:hypothetical protein